MFAGVKHKRDIAFQETDLIRAITRISFYEFLKEFWDTIITDPFIDNWHIRYLCDEVQKVVMRVIKEKPKRYDLIINISPGSTKSTIVSIMLPAWVWVHKPSFGIVGASYTHELATDLSRRNRMMVRSDKYREIFPEIIISDEQDAKGHFANTSGGERNSVGIGGDITGRHGDVILIDDPIYPKGARSDAEMKAANSFIIETLWNRKKSKENTPTILIMQRLHQNDPSAVLLKMAGEGKLRIKHICLPAEISGDVNPPELKQYYRNGLMDPIRLSRRVLSEHHGFGDFYYTGQFMQNPVPLGGGMFKAGRIVIDEIPPLNKFLRIVRYWDKASTKDAGAYTAGVKIGEDNKHRFWFLDVKRGRWDSSGRENVIKQTAELDGKNVFIGIEQEPGSGGKESAEATVKNLRGFKVRTDKVTGSKENRADPLSSQVNSGNTYMIKGDWNSDFIDEMSFFPDSTYKDQIDAASGAFAMLEKMKRVIGGF